MLQQLCRASESAYLAYTAHWLQLAGLRARQVNLLKDEAVIGHWTYCKMPWEGEISYEISYDDNHSNQKITMTLSA